MERAADKFAFRERMSINDALKKSEKSRER
jgi:hypothetical protein